MRQTRFVRALMVPGIILAFLCGLTGTASAESKNDKVFSATVTDAQGIESEVKNVHFYWEEKVSETAFVPHELRHVPVKRGTATVNVKFDTIKQIDIKPASDKGLPTLLITLTNGKTGEFGLAIDGKFKGESDFGEVELPAGGLRKVVFK
ncbi:hypothetical protein DNFV4_01324 [Nitrospira tepida]|uniref:Lipoprotein n=1 Tax=Nitrospira tepida TaxID=2973512 RepID=A0AA86T5U2_9BACT|nr:hypothetical protein [Nitrospira tepida]CAI4030892.1 hypothetical protein DNFV4_01324 [Nitrospira tepida]